MEIIILIIPFLLAVVLGKLIIPYIMLITYKKRLFDPIDARKIHQHIIPRLGGVAFVPIQCCLLAITIILVYKLNFVDLRIATWEVFPMFIMLICGMVILYITGIADDLIGVGYRWKFLVQIIVASLLPLSGLWINDLYGLAFITQLPIWVGVPLTVFIVVLIINAINLIDGLDGLCSGLVGIGCLVLGMLFVYYQAWIHALFAFITTGILISFFYYNVFGTSKRRRRIFMGDTGSMTLGYTMAFLTISFSMNNEFVKPFAEGAIVIAFSTLIIPVFDVIRVIFLRWKNRQPLFKPDRNHLHHKLLNLGLSHKSAMLVIISISLIFCLVNILLVQLISNNLVLVIDVFLWICFNYGVEVLFAFKKQPVSEKKPSIDKAMPLVKKYNF